ncbi:hypothetical protein JW948_07490 [bacterium]|nr:hypothetical protein [bacterium]
MRKRTGCILTAVLVLVLAASAVRAQMTSRALGMGSAYTALARGVHAADWNPANLGLPDNPKFSMSFIAAGAQIGNNSFTQGMYNKYVGKALSRSDVADIMSSIPDGGLRFGARGAVRALSFSVNRFAVTIGGDFGGYANIEKTIFEFIFEGNELYRDYNMDDIDGGGEGVGLLGFSYGDQIEADWAEILTVGGRLNFLYGFGYAKIEKSQFDVRFDDFGFNIHGDYEARTASGNMGWSLDAGSCARINDKLTVGVTLSNLLGNLSWDKDIKQVMGYIDADSVDALDFEEKEGEEDLVADSSWSEDGSRFSTRLPVQLRMGAMYEEGDFIMTADYAQGFGTSAWMNAVPQFSFGTEWRRVKWLPLRMGVLLGGRFGFGTSFGFGLRPGGFIWDVAVMNRGFVTGNSSKGLIVATEIGMEL